MHATLRSVLAFALVLGLSGTALAESGGHSRCDNAVNAYSAASGVIALTTGPFGIGWGIGAGLGQCGYYIYRAVKDPPDIVNAGIPVNVAAVQSGNEIQPFAVLVPTMDATSAAKFDTMVGNLTHMVALARSVNMSLDRWQGAMIVGNATWATDRWTEAGSLLSQLKAEQSQYRTALLDVIARTDAVAPGLLDAPVTQADLAQWRDFTIAGQLPTLEPIPFTQWNITADEHQFMKDSAAFITNPSINDFMGGAASMPARDLLIYTTDICIECLNAQQIPVPEPTGLALLVMAALPTVRMRRRR